MRFLRIPILALMASLCLTGLADARGGGFSGGGGHSFSGGGSHSFSGGGSHSYGGSSHSYGGSSKGFSSPTPSYHYSPPAAPKGFSAPERPRAGNMPSITQSPSTEHSFPSAAPKAPLPNFDSGAQKATRDAQAERSYRELHPTPPPPARDLSSTGRGPGTTAERPSIWPRSTPSSTPYVERREYRESGGASDWLLLWLILNQGHDRDRYIYDHRDRFTEQQMEELRKKDADLERRLKEFESAGVARDTSSTIPAAAEAARPPAPTPAHASRWWLWVGLLIGVASLVYLVFFYRFPAKRRYA